MAASTPWSEAVEAVRRPIRDLRWRPLREHAGVDDTRVDRWLWGVRAYKTRSAAATGCAAGHVEVNDVKAKPATKVKVGDTVAVQLGPRRRILEVVEVIDKRVGAPRAAECFRDHSPPVEALPPPTFVRDRGAGPPTKRDRRKLDQLRGRRGER